MVGSNQSKTLEGSLSPPTNTEYDPELAGYFPVIKNNHPVALRDNKRHFSPQAVDYLYERGILPYIFDPIRGEVTFVIDTSIHETMTLDEFKVDYGDLVGSFSPELKKTMFSSTSKISFIPFEHRVMEKLHPYIVDPELITRYDEQRDMEKNIALGIINDTEAGKFVDGIINRAIQERASDIHFESLGGRKYQIRFRIDGNLVVNPTPIGYAMYRSAVTILKNKCGAGVDIAEKRRPQDGKLEHIDNTPDVSGQSKIYDLRAAFRPVVGDEGVVKKDSSDGTKSEEHFTYEENVILRIARRGTFKTLDQLGLSDYDHGRINEVCNEPNGIILVTGPTGSGKTTTLYGMLHSINDSTRKIVTIEDPVEVRMSGLQQTQVHKEIGVDFASFLRGALRADPDVIFVGEIRDKETADTALEAAMTGHLVMSSLHTNNAPGAVYRLIGMGASQLDLATNMRGVLAQTLVPVFEEGLKQRILDGTLTEEDKKHIWPVEGDKVLNTLIGESHYSPGSICFYSGDESVFKGREALTEFWLIDEKSQDAISSPSTGTSVLTRAAEESGMRPMFISGVEKVVSGTTSLESVLGAVGSSVFRRKKHMLKNFLEP